MGLVTLSAEQLQKIAEQLKKGKVVASSESSDTYKMCLVFILWIASRILNNVNWSLSFEIL
jgi:hypothetical protein